MRITLFLITLLLAFQAHAIATTEVLVLTTATAMPAASLRRFIEIQNLGPNDIFCAGSSAGAVVNKARRISANGGTWNYTAGDRVWCVAASANQVTGAATIVSEIK
jgi:hypothetical protein